MAKPGDIIEIPYQEGTCRRCGWTVTRDNASEAWHGQLGGDCRADDDGEHYVTVSKWLTRQARIAEAVMTTVTLLKRDKVVMRQQFPGDANWDEWWDEPKEITQVTVSHRKYQYHAALEDE